MYNCVGPALFGAMSFRPGPWWVGASDWPITFERRRKWSTRLRALNRPRELLQADASSNRTAAQ